MSTKITRDEWQAELDRIGPDRDILGSENTNGRLRKTRGKWAVRFHGPDGETMRVLHGATDVYSARAKADAVVSEVRGDGQPPPVPKRRGNPSNQPRRKTLGEVVDALESALIVLKEIRGMM